MCRNTEFEARLRNYFGSNITAAHLKMAETPDDEATLIDYMLDNGEQSKFPIVRCRNIYVLPGVN